MLLDCEGANLWISEFRTKRNSLSFGAFDAILGIVLPAVTTVPATFDGFVLKPDSPLALSPNSRVMVSIVRTELDEETGEWSEQSEARRCDLIDKDIQGDITDEERCELQLLQAQFDRYLDDVSPLPMDGALELHRKLLEKKQAGQAE